MRRHSVLHKYGLQDTPFLDYTIMHRHAKMMFIDMLVSENGRNNRIIFSYVSFRVKRWHRTGAVDSTRFNLSNTNL